MEQVKDLHFHQLKNIAKELKIKGRTKMNKENLIKSIKKFSEEEIINEIKKKILIINIIVSIKSANIFVKSVAGRNYVFTKK